MPQEKDNVYSTISSGIKDITSIFGTKEQSRLTEKQTALAIQQAKIAEQQARAAEAASQAEKAKAESENASFLAKMKAKKAILIPVAIAGSLAIIAVAFYFYKKK